MNNKRMIPTLSAVAVLLTACGGTSSDSASPPLLMRSGATTAAQPVAADYYELVQRIYLAYFGRPAEPAGQQYWAETFLKLGLLATVDGLMQSYDSNVQVRQLLQAFADSPEARDLYAGTNGEVINSIYANLLTRYAEPAGRDYWKQLLDGQLLAQPAVALNIMRGAQGDDLLLIGKKLQVAAKYTAAVAAAGLVAQQDPKSAPLGNDLLAKVTKDTDLAAFQSQIDAVVATLGSTDTLTSLHYTGFHYLQDVGGGSPYTVLYRSPAGDFSPFRATYKFGLSSRVVSVSADTAVPPQQVFAAPVTYTVRLPLHPAATLAPPAVAMLCQPVPDDGGARGKSTDILVANSSRMLTSAKELANQTLSIYREDCATVGEGATAPNVQSYVFDAAGNATVASAGGVATYSASVVTQLLQGRAVYDLVSRRYTAIRAYRYAQADGTLRYVLISHSTQQQVNASRGTLAMWTQE
jgi:hypothetical protein